MILPSIAFLNITLAAYAINLMAGWYAGVAWFVANFVLGYILDEDEF